MGSPDFAVYSLVALYNKGIEIKAVVTQPDKERGRGKNITFTPVKTKALELGLPVLQPVRMKDPFFVETLKELKADLFVVVAFRILPETVLRIPASGSINLHASLLPDYRGAAPINHAIFNGEKETGVTVFFLNNKEVDSGDIIAQVKIPIEDSDNFGALYTKLALLGKDVLAESVDKIFSGNAAAYKQETVIGKKAPKLFADDFIIDWKLPAFSIFNKIRGLSPKPGAGTSINGRRIKIISAFFEDCSCEHEPGTIIIADRKKGLISIATGKGILTVTKVQLESRPVTDVKSFLNGNRIESGDIFK